MKPPEIKPNSASMNMTPMIDVVFLLIIFFLVSSNLIQQDTSMELDLPAAETSQLAEETETRKITVNVPKPGSLFLGSQSIDRERLREHFLQCRLAWGDGTEVRIRTNKDVPYGEVAPILVLAAQCGIWNVSFAVTEKRAVQ